MTRRFLVGGNWKMNGTSASIIELCKLLVSGQLNSCVDVVIGCPSPYITHTRLLLPPSIGVAGQNAYKVATGPFTGELSPAMLKDAGADWLILGHSERRQIFKESNELIAEKCAHAIAEGLKIIACIGETLEERESGKTTDVVAGQMASIVEQIKDGSNIVLAYEPIWAIGTGKSATPEEAQEIHAYLRSWLDKNISKSVSDSVRIQYGGSVTGENCKDLAKQPDIDGFLVGGASLKPEFLDIVNCGEVKKEIDQ